MELIDGTDVTDRRIEMELINSHARETQREENKAVQAIKENNKFFFNYARNKSNVKNGIWPLEEDGKAVVEDKSKADVFLK